MSRAITKRGRGRGDVFANPRALDAGGFWALLDQLPRGTYRAILTVTKIRRRRGAEVAATPVFQHCGDLVVRGRRRRKEIAP